MSKLSEWINYNKLRKTVISWLIINFGGKFKKKKIQDFYEALLFSFSFILILKFNLVQEKTFEQGICLLWSTNTKKFSKKPNVLYTIMSVRFWSFNMIFFQFDTICFNYQGGCQKITNFETSEPTFKLTLVHVQIDHQVSVILSRVLLHWSTYIP